MTQCKNFNIRIMFTPAKKEVTTKKEPSYIYNWHRITAALLLLFAILAITVYMFYIPTNQQTNMAPLAQIKTAPLQIVKDISTTQPTTKENAIANITKTQTAIQEAPIAIQTDIKAEPLTAEKVISKIVSEKETEVIAATPVTKEVTLDIATENKITDKNQQSLFSQPTSTIFSEHIKTFVMAKAVIDKEPRGNLEEVTFEHNNIAKVYAFSLAVGLVDQSLIYTWQLNGKQVAQVEVGVGSDRWRSYSSKFIQPSMHGKWRVILGNKKGEILAVSEFDY